MKLLMCKKCGDVFSIAVERPKSCGCGAVSGQYDRDELNAWYSGNAAVPLGFHNGSFTTAIHNQPKTGAGKDFTAFVIPENCGTFRQK